VAPAPANDNKPTAADGAVQIVGFTADKVVPVLLKVLIADPNLGTITFQFSEPVNAASVNFTAITVQDGATSKPSKKPNIRCRKGQG